MLLVVPLMSLEVFFDLQVPVIILGLRSIDLRLGAICEVISRGGRCLIGVGLLRWRLGIIFRQGRVVDDNHFVLSGVGVVVLKAV